MREPDQLEFDFMRGERPSEPVVDPITRLVVLMTLTGVMDLCEAAERRETRRAFRLAA